MSETPSISNNTLEKAGPRVVFLNHHRSQCGVYEFGRNIGKALDGSKYVFLYRECGSVDELNAIIGAESPDLIIYNYNPATMSWLTNEFTGSLEVPQIGIIHEVTQIVADWANNTLFNFHIAHDPTLLLKNPIVFKAGRLIPQYENTFDLPGVPTIGSFGFAGKKGHRRIVEMVNSEFDEAVIRFNIPFATFGDADGSLAKAIADECRRMVTKKGIELIITHDFFEETELLDFLAKNTINLFLYEHMDEQRGISATPDLALAVRRPIGITRQSMFRHIVGLRPSICVEDSSIRQIIDNDMRPFEAIYDEWSEEVICWDYERIAADVLAREMIPPIMVDGEVKKLLRRVKRRVDRLLGRSIEVQSIWIGDTSIRDQLQAPVQGATYTSASIPDDWPLNNILDDQAREIFRPTIDQMFSYLPEMMGRKISEANVQQAFVLDTVYNIISKIDDPKTLCVGSFEDSAAESLKVLGFNIDEVDPMINYDLETFLTKPTTRPASYDVVLSTSVIEHVEDDIEFLRQIVSLLKPGGIAVLTCDYLDTYKPGDPKPVVDQRLYTRKDISGRLLAGVPDCKLLGDADWDCQNPDFWFEGVNYTFASIVVKKTG